MSKNSLYLRSPRSLQSSSKSGNFYKAFVSLFFSIMVLLVGVSSVAGPNLASAQEDPGAGEGVSFDVVRYVMCYWGPDAMPGKIYQVSQTSDFQFATQSKSSITSGLEDVGTGPWGMNMILDIAGYEFTETNEMILGHPLHKVGNEVPDDDEEDPASDWNQGTPVSPFERFGVAGMRYTGYSGEWKYIVVQACNPTGEALDPKTGLYYEDRLVPQSVWEDRNGSEDIRSLQHARGFGTHMDMAFLNLIANIIFDFAKAIVVFCVSFINFAFSDIVSLLGLSDMIGGTATTDGIFTRLFEGLFQPLIIMVFALTGMNILWNGIVKRQYRTAFVTTLRSIFMWFAAIVIAANPAFWIAIPNNVAVVFQSVLVTAMNDGISGGEGMCTIGGTPTDTEVTEGTSGMEDQDLLTQASVNMRNAIGCSFWQQFLFVPWVQGQYGVSWNEVWAKDSIPGWAPEGASSVTNGDENAEMVGDAQVPLGGGTVLNNWALFQISTQTNAHSPIGNDGGYSKYTSGVANDWWRIVDALANYEEEDDIFVIPNPSGGPAEEVTIRVPKDTEHHEAWAVWTGNSIGGRLLSSLSAVFVAGIGVIAPMFFAFLSAVYAIGIAILMAFAPVMLLLGCWAGVGWDMFKAWGELVVTTTLKRIIVGVLLVISILISAALIEIMETDNWWTGIIFMVLISIILIRSRSKIAETVASVQFSRVSFSGTANNLMGKTVGTGKTVGKTAVMGAAGGVAGGVASKRNGGSMIKGVRAGAGAGMRTELRNLSYRSKPVREAMRSYDSVKHEQDKTVDKLALIRPGQRCHKCETLLDSWSWAYLDSVGHAYCEDCGDSMGDQDGLRMVSIREDGYKPGVKEIETRPLETSYDDKHISELKEDLKNEDEETIASAVRQESTLLNEDIARYTSMRSEGLPLSPPQPPKELARYIDISSLDRAWKAGNWVYIKQVYAIAWATWAVDAFEKEFNGLAENIVMDLDTRDPNQPDNSDDDDDEDEEWDDDE